MRARSRGGRSHVAKLRGEANLAQEIEIDAPDVPELSEYRIDEGDYEEPNSNDEEASNQNATTNISFRLTSCLKYANIGTTKSC